MYNEEQSNSLPVLDEYNDYLSNHIKGVQKAYQWLKKNLPELLKYSNDYEDNIHFHDGSKFSNSEYMPYAQYFYGKKTDSVKKAFDYAWNDHQKRNQHHWQYWVLINDKDDIKTLDMPYSSIVEMVCDHWAFSWVKDNLYEIFDWYDKNKDKMMLSDYTRKTYESILDKIKDKLDEGKADGKK